MAKGSVRKKGKKWYYRFYVEDESGNSTQREYVGTESKSETQALLRKAMDEYENTKIVAKSQNVTLGDLLDMWIDNEQKHGNLSNGSIMAYQGTIGRIKKHPIGKRKLKKITSDHLQSYMDLLTIGDETHKPLSNGYIRQYSAVLQGAFKYAVFPKRLIAFNPMQYVVTKRASAEYELFADNADEEIHTISHKQYEKLIEYLTKKESVALLPVQIAYYTGLRIGEVCGLTWQDIDFDKQQIVVRRSMRYNSKRHKTEVGATKSKKIRTVDFGDKLKNILTVARQEQKRNKKKYGGLHSTNYYTAIKENSRTYYDVYVLPTGDEAPDDYKKLNLVCTKPDGSFTSPSGVEGACRSARGKLKDLDDSFHFHTLRHTFASNLLANGASPKDLQELLGHASVTTSVGIYGHSVGETKRNCVKSLDTLV